jgi:hypothetical protein
MKKIILLIILNCSLLNAQWIPYTLPYNGIAYCLAFNNLNNGISCGHTLFPFNEKIYYTSNSGMNWLPASCPPEIRALSNVIYINSSLIYACGAENLFARKSYSNINDFKFLPYFLKQRLLNEGRRELSSGYKAAFLKSTNAGLSWQKAAQFDTITGYMNDFFFFDANTGYSLIDSGSYGNSIFYKTTNAGVNWQKICKVDSSSQVGNLIFFNMNTGFAKGFYNGGFIYKTTNAGLNWSKEVMPTQIDAIYFFNATTGIAIGITESSAYSKIYRTTNAGNQWNTVTDIPNRMYNKLSGLQSTGTAFGIGNLIDSNLFFTKISSIKTTDFGVTWTVKDFNPELLSEGVCLVDANNYFISGGNLNYPATVLKSTNGGNVFVSQTGNNIPDKFSLSQNYPNPFNPSTNIRYQIPKNSFVILKVYNILGKEIATLVNEKLSPGEYESTFDGGNLPSGVYFYSLYSDGVRIDTKKLVMLK